MLTAKEKRIIDALLLMGDDMEDSRSPFEKGMPLNPKEFTTQWIVDVLRNFYGVRTVTKTVHRVNSLAERFNYYPQKRRRR